MAPSLVGSLGAVSVSASGSAATPTFGQTPTAGSLLICWMATFGGGVTAPAAPSGWGGGTAGIGVANDVAIYTRTAAGGDSAPSFAGATGQVQAAMLGEFAGVRLPLDQVGGNSQTTGVSPLDGGAFTGVDAQAGELVVMVGCVSYSDSTTKTLALSANNGIVVHNETTNNATATGNHYDFGWGVTTGKSVADDVSLSFTTTNGVEQDVLGESFLLPVPTFLLSTGSIEAKPGFPNYMPGFH